MARTASFKVKDSFYENKKLGAEKDKFYCWDANRGFLLINKVGEKIAKVEES